jgi:hypothetical protein
MMGLSIRPPARLSTLNRLLRQVDIRFRPILYDARDSNRAFGKEHLEKCRLSKLRWQNFPPLSNSPLFQGMAVKNSFFSVSHPNLAFL